MSKAIETKIKCPFYRYEGHAFIVCEGIKEKEKELYFVTDTDKQKWEKGVCCVENGRSCSRHQLIMKEKYSDERKIVNEQSKTTYHNNKPCKNNS